MKNIGLLIASAVLLLSAYPSRAQIPGKDPKLEATLKKFMLQHLRNLASEDEEKSLAFFHPASPAKAQAQQSFAMLFPTTRFRYELLFFTLLAQDNDYVYVRFKQRTTLIGKTKLPTQGKRSELDAVMTFKKHKQQWKGWKSMILSSSVN